jgi:hypothetical protein
MGTLLGILDFIVLLLIVASALRALRKERPEGSASLVLSLCVALALIVFGTVSITAYLGLVEVVSSLTHVIFLVILLVMAAIISQSWSGEPAA